MLANALPLLLPAEEKAYRISEKPCGPGFRTLLVPAGMTLAIAVPDEHHEAGHQERDRGHLHFIGLDLLAEVLGRPADHEAREEYRDDREHEHAVQAAADAAEHDLAELHQPDRHEPAERRERTVHRVDRAIRGRGRRRGPERGVRDAEARFLSFHVAAGLICRGSLVDAESRELRIPRLLGGEGTEEQRNEDDEHGGEQRPALPAVADHAPEGVAERRRDQQDREHLEEVRERRRVLERVRGVHVEEPASVGAELLDGDLARGRPERDRLLGHLLALPSTSIVTGSSSSAVR